MQKIAIFGVPRSGTSWIGQLFNSSENVVYRYQPIFSYSFPNKIDASSSSEEIKFFHSKLLATDDPFVCQKLNVSGKKTPEFPKGKLTHLVWKEVRYLEIIENLIQNSETKIIGIIRHPCGVIKSWVNAPKEFEESWNLIHEWRKAEKKNLTIHDYYGFDKWIETSNNLIELSNRYSNKVILVSYEKLIQDTNKELKRLFKFCSIKFTNQVREFISDSSTTESDDPYDIFRNNKKIDEWKKVLPTQIIDEILKDENFLEVKKYFDEL